MKASYSLLCTERGRVVWENLLRSGHEYELWKQGDVVELRLAAKWEPVCDCWVLDFSAVLILATRLACSLYGDTTRYLLAVTSIPAEVVDALLNMYVEWLLQDKE